MIEALRKVPPSDGVALGNEALVSLGCAARTILRFGGVAPEEAARFVRESAGLVGPVRHELAALRASVAELGPRGVGDGHLGSEERLARLKDLILSRFEGPWPVEVAPHAPLAWTHRDAPLSHFVDMILVHLVGDALANGRETILSGTLASGFYSGNAGSTFFAVAFSPEGVAGLASNAYASRWEREAWKGESDPLRFLGKVPTVIAPLACAARTA